MKDYEENPLCACGCGLPVNKYRNTFRKYINGGHATREQSSKRMMGNTLFAGRKHSDEVKQNMSKRQRGENNTCWKGGKTIAYGGYVMLLKPEHHRADINGRVHEEVIIMENILGRFLLPEEVIHHKNEIKTDNRPENLQLFKNKSEHMSYHAKKRWDTDGFKTRRRKTWVSKN